MVAFVFLLALGLNGFAQTAATVQGPVIVGFLDDDRMEMANWKPGISHIRLIRPAFEKNASGWHPVKPESLTPRMSWTVAFDGKKLGEIEGRLDSQPPSVTETVLTAPNLLPTVGTPSSAFAGLLAMGPTQIRRPLVLVSKPNFKDPDGWKRLKITPDEVVSAVRSAFRHDFQHVVRCKDEEVVERDWKFPDSSLRLVTVYGSAKHSFLVETELSAGNCGYVDDPNDPFSDPWFYVSENGVARRIGAFMTLLDAGDYDADGRSEVVFFLSQPEDTDGFVLFDATMHEQARLTWSYH